MQSFAFSVLCVLCSLTALLASADPINDALKDAFTCNKSHPLCLGVSITLSSKGIHQLASRMKSQLYSKIFSGGVGGVKIRYASISDFQIYNNDKNKDQQFQIKFHLQLILLVDVYITTLPIGAGGDVYIKIYPKVIDGKVTTTDISCDSQLKTKTGSDVYDWMVDFIFSAEKKVNAGLCNKARAEGKELIENTFNNFVPETTMLATKGDTGIALSLQYSPHFTFSFQQDRWGFNLIGKVFMSEKVGSNIKDTGTPVYPWKQYPMPDHFGNATQILTFMRCKKMVCMAINTNIFNAFVRAAQSLNIFQESFTSNNVTVTIPKQPDADGLAPIEFAALNCNEKPTESFVVRSTVMSMPLTIATLLHLAIVDNQLVLSAPDVQFHANDFIKGKAEKDKESVKKQLNDILGHQKIKLPIPAGLNPSEIEIGYVPPCKEPGKDGRGGFVSIEMNVEF